MVTSSKGEPGTLDSRLAEIEILQARIISRVQALETREGQREQAAQAMQVELRETFKSLGPLGVLKKLLFNPDKSNGEAQQITR